MTMKVFFHDDFYREYTSDPAAESGRMESIVEAIEDEVLWMPVQPIPVDRISLVHTREQIERVKRQGVYDIACLAAGGAYQAAVEGLKEPCFGLVRPPGHHASSGNAWGFCYFNNMAIAIKSLIADKQIRSAYILDIDMHFGDGTDNILKHEENIIVHNIEEEDREKYLQEVEEAMNHCEVDLIGISAGFDNHINDWGGVLKTEDYYHIGSFAAQAAKRGNGGLFAILEGGYNHQVLGRNTLALIKGMQERN